MQEFFNKYFRLKTVSFLGCSLIMLVAIATSCENDIEVIQAFSGDLIMPSQSMIDAEIEYTDSARVQVRISAPEIHNYTTGSEKYMEFPFGVFARFYDRNGDVESQMTSQYALYLTDKELWEAKDSVVVINREGEILRTEQLFWDERTRMIYSHSFVEITRPDEIITGEGFEADETFTHWQIKKISGTFYLRDDEFSGDDSR